ncbi:MAG: hypothetical protein HY699_14000 [Deltaproteobacteria bacterium]|nr:hypothetical protein [Deltaproteobacteria bacterium]
MTATRLRELLAAYGADPERWPLEERDEALALLAQSEQARRWQEAGSQLDSLLDLVPAKMPSPELLERILAATPPTRTPPRRTALSAFGAAVRARPRVWRYTGAAALPLAAAAALVLWLQSAPTPAPERAPVAIAELGVYQAPTDALLTAPGLDALEDVPSFGCAGTGLGCLDLEPSDTQSAIDRETYV